MTRGTFFIILKDRFVASVEFNGDMYPGKMGYGDLGFGLLDKVEDEEGFRKMVLDFNSQTHRYNDEVMFWEGEYEKIKKHFDMSKGYYDFWFSDWIFIKNLSGKNIKFNVLDYTTEEKLKYTLKHGKSVRFYFGKVREESEKV